MTDEELRQKITECLPIQGDGYYLETAGMDLQAMIDDLVALFKTYCAEERASRDTNAK